MPDIQKDYEDRLVAYVDILGWTQATETKHAWELLQTLQPVIDRGSFHNEYMRQTALEKHGDRVNPVMLGVQFGFFSDCFVSSVPASFEGRIYSIVSDIMRPLLKQGFVLRGGIAAGKLFHQDNVVFGPALIRAYRIEQDEAKFARILVDRSALLASGAHEHNAVIQDHLGNWIIDPFPCIASTEESHMHDLLCQFFDPATVVRTIGVKLREYENKPRLHDIWRFQAEVCAISLEKYGSPAADWVNELRALVV